MERSTSFVRSLQQIKANLKTALSSTVIVGIIGLATLAINTRALSVGDVGTIAAVQAYALLVSGLLTLSTHLPVMRMGTEAVENGRIAELHGIIGYAFRLDMTAGIAAAIVTALLATVAGDYIGVSAAIRQGLSIYIVPMLFSSLSSATGLLRLVDRFDMLRTVEVLAATSLLVAVILLGLAGAPVTFYLVAYALVFGLTFVARYMVARIVVARKFPKIDPASPLAPSLRRHFRSFAASSSLGSSIDTLRTNVDTIAATSLFGREGAGIYGVAKQAAGAVRKFAGFTSLISFVEFSRMTARGEIAERRRLFHHVLKICAATALVTIIVAALLGRPALTHGFGPQYASGYWVLLLLVAGAGLQFVMNPISMNVQIIRGGMPAMLCNLVGLLAFGVALAPLALLFGLAGIAAASLIYFLVAILSGAWLIRPGTAPRLADQDRS